MTNDEAPDREDFDQDLAKTGPSRANVPWRELSGRWWRDAAARVVLITVVTAAYAGLINRFWADIPRWVGGLAYFPLIGFWAVYWPSRASPHGTEVPLRQAPMVLGATVAAMAFLTTLGFLAYTGISNLFLSPDGRSELSTFNDELAQIFKDKPKGTSRAFAVIKDGFAGPEWLMTVHGYADNRATCQAIIEPYNTNPELSVFEGRYSCKEL